MHILPVLAGLEVLVLGGGPDIFFFVHLNCGSNQPAHIFRYMCGPWERRVFFKACGAAPAANRAVTAH